MKRKYMFMALLCYALTTAAQDASHNYVRTRSMLDETGGKYLDKVEYYDGLGRPFQTVLKKVTASNSNLVTLQEYDVAGRAVNSWLPIVSSAEYVAPAAFKSSAPSNYGNDSRPYGQRGQGSGTREEEKEEHSKGLLSVPSGLSPLAGALYLFRQSSWLSGLRPAAFLLRGLPIGRSFAGEGGRELFLQKVPSSGPIPLPRQVSFRQKAPDLPR